MFLSAVCMDGLLQDTILSSIEGYEQVTYMTVLVRLCF